MVLRFERSTTISTPSPTAGLSLAGLADGSGTNTVVAPGESVIITDLTPADFRTEWGLKSSVKVINDGTFTLKKSGSVYISNGTAVLDQVAYDLTVPGKGVSAWVSAANVADQQTASGSTFSFAPLRPAPRTGGPSPRPVTRKGPGTPPERQSVGSPAASTLGTSTPTSVRLSALSVSGGANQTGTVGTALLVHRSQRLGWYGSLHLERSGSQRHRPEHRSVDRRHHRYARLAPAPST